MSRSILLLLAACAPLTAPPADPQLGAAMGGPIGGLFTLTTADTAVEGETFILHVTGLTLAEGDVVELYRGRTAGAGSCVHPEYSPQPCLGVTGHEQLVATATAVTIFGDVNYAQATFELSLPYSDQTETWFQAVVLTAGSADTSDLLQVAIEPGRCDPGNLPFGGGGGGFHNPYMICAPEHWQNMEGGGSRYELADDLYADGEDLRIRAFDFGDLNGAGFTVYVGPSDQAVFGYIGPEGVVHDITFAEVEVISDRDAAGVAAWLDGTMERVEVYGSVLGPSSTRWSPDWKDYSTGGVVANAGADSLLSQIYADVVVDGGHRTGGIAGYTAGDIVNSAATVNVLGEAAVGGIVGLVEGGLVEGCFVEGSVYGYQCFVGGAIGRLRGAIGAADVDTDVSVYGERTDVGGVVGGADGGLFTELSSTSSVYSEGTRTGGVFGTLVSGDVEGVEITGASVYGEGRYTGGFAGVSAADSVTDISAEGLQVYGEQLGVGGLIGYNANGTVTDSYAAGQVYGEGSAVGGLIGMNGAPSVPKRRGGRNWQPTIVNYVPPDITSVLADVQLYGERNANGGLIGLQVDGSVESAFVTGSIYGVGADTGGLIGLYNYGVVHASGVEAEVFGEAGPVGGVIGTMTTDFPLTESWSRGTVGSYGVAGGFVGLQTAGAIRRSVSDADVNALGVAGGFVGKVDFEAIISDSYATGDVTSAGACMEIGVSAGGFVGATMNAALHIGVSYALNDYIFADIEQNGHAFLGGVACGDLGDPDAAIANGVYDDERFIDPWAGTIGLAGAHPNLTSYPNLLSPVWSEAAINPFAPNYTGSSIPALTWQCTTAGFFCGLLDVN
jgi:hypothetical protein